MWLTPDDLPQTLRMIAANLPPIKNACVTMTGEMADVFRDRDQGVAMIVQHTLAADLVAPQNLFFYAIPGRFLSARETTKYPAVVASANWHGVARWVSTWIEAPSLVMDIGTTTSDLIPVYPGKVGTASVTDFDRLRAGELVYLGAKRTPVCSIVSTLPFRGNEIPVMRERFASTDDCGLILGWSPEEPQDTDTCDGQPRTQNASTRRMARMIGLDGHRITPAEASAMALRVVQTAGRLLHEAIAKHDTSVFEQWITLGNVHRFLSIPPQVRHVKLEDHVETGLLHDAASAHERIGPMISRVGPAFAICELFESGHLAS